MSRCLVRWIVLGLLLAGAAINFSAIWAEPPTTGLRFEVTVAPGLLAQPTDGRLLVVIGKRGLAEPRANIGETGLEAPPVLGADVNGFAPGVVGLVDGSSEIFPIENLAKLPAGDYVAQAVFDWNADLRMPNSPGNLYSEPKAVTIDPAKNSTFKLTLTKQTQPDKTPADTASVKYLKVQSKLLSQFHGRPMYLRAGVILPRNYGQDPNQK